MLVPTDQTYHPEDEDLQAFLRSNNDRWALAHMSLSFPLSRGPDIQNASIQVDLSDDGNPPSTIAVSILPTREGAPYEVTCGFMLSPKVDISGRGGITLGSIDSKTIRHGELLYLTGGPELSPSPQWQFQKTSTCRLEERPTRLVMIIRVPAGRVGFLGLGIEAFVKSRYIRRDVPLVEESATPEILQF
jgi:hypothetical protein